MTLGLGELQEVVEFLVGLEDVGGHRVGMTVKGGRTPSVSSAAASKAITAR
ncbi:hypothetical protein ACFY36_29735 [Actinoplanes sp. NPDC000266]